MSINCLGIRNSCMEIALPWYITMRDLDDKITLSVPAFLPLTT